MRGSMSTWSTSQSPVVPVLAMNRSWTMRQPASLVTSVGRRLTSFVSDQAGGAALDGRGLRLLGAEHGVNHVDAQQCVAPAGEELERREVDAEHGAGGRSACKKAERLGGCAEPQRPASARRPGAARQRPALGPRLEAAGRGKEVVASADRRRARRPLRQLKASACQARPRRPQQTRSGYPPNQLRDV